MLRLVTPPADLAVDIDEARRHLRVQDEDSDDALISAYIEAAQQSLAYLGRAFRPATYALDLCYFGCSWTRLPMPPLRSVNAILVTDANGDQTALDESLYTVSTSDEGIGSIRLAYGQSWPSSRGDLGSVSIEFDAGYDDVPAALRAAILLIVGSLYENRSAASPVAMTALPGGVDALVAPYRIFNL